jgi:hypothetical protein
MTLHLRPASTLATVAVLLWLAPASIASAQDAMELDLAFKNSMSQAHAPTLPDERHKVRGRRHEVRGAREMIAGEKRRAGM